ncbi:MAG: hypothetical protein AAF542_25165 [Pseudomonadota bacterium]
MKALAEFVMRGRVQATAVAMAGVAIEFLFWVSGAVIALVTMRKGSQHGAMLLLWSMLPAAVLAWLKFPGALLCLLASFLMAVVLRTTQQWSTALLAGAACSMASAIVLQFAFPGYVESILELFRAVFEQLFKGSTSNKPLEDAIAGVTTEQVAGAISAAAGFFAVVSLVLGRYWQASLYNPGGFGEEFRALRFRKPMAVGLVLLGLLLMSSEHYRLWAMMCLLPLVISGIALVHWLVNRYSGSGGLLVGFYFLLLTIAPVTQLVCALALADSFIDIRQRQSKNSEPRD